MKALRLLAAGTVAAIVLAGCSSGGAVNQSSAPRYLDDSARTAIEPFNWNESFGTEAARYVDPSFREAKEPFEWGDVYHSSAGRYVDNSARTDAEPV